MLVPDVRDSRERHIRQPRHPSPDPVKDRRPDRLQRDQGLILKNLPLLTKIVGFLSDPKDRVLSHPRDSRQILHRQRTRLNRTNKLRSIPGAKHLAREINRRSLIPSLKEPINLTHNTLKRLRGLLTILRQIHKRPR